MLHGVVVVAVASAARGTAHCVDVLRALAHVHEVVADKPIILVTLVVAARALLLSAAGAHRSLPSHCQHSRSPRGKSITCWPTNMEVLQASLRATSIKSSSQFYPAPKLHNTLASIHGGVRTTAEWHTSGRNHECIDHDSITD